MLQSKPNFDELDGTIISISSASVKRFLTKSS
nr:MAG TPA: hypothetical protein [Caudoviricetes sp.]